MGDRLKRVCRRDGNRSLSSSDENVKRTGCSDGFRELFAVRCLGDRFLGDLYFVRCEASGRQDVRGQNSLRIGCPAREDGELRCYFKNSSLHTAGAALSSLRRDIANHGETVVEFNTLPQITSRIANTGRTIYDVAE